MCSLVRSLLLLALACGADAMTVSVYDGPDCKGKPETSPMTEKCAPIWDGSGTMSCSGKEVTVLTYTTKDCSDKAATIKLTDGVCKKMSSSGSYKADCATSCFARSTSALLESGESILMTSLKSGDIVMDAPNSLTRIIVNQHARSETIVSGLLKIEHGQGNLSLTPDHVLSVDGKFVAAREAKVGTMLGNAEVSRVTSFFGEIVNPLTASGKILTQGGVLASTYPEWIAGYMLNSYVPLPFSTSNLISYFFPATTQAYYDAVLEPLFQSTSSGLVGLQTAIPQALVPVVFIVADAAVSIGFVVYSLASLKAGLLILTASAAVKSRK